MSENPPQGKKVNAMGSTGFFEEYRGDLSAEDAYSELWDEARAEYGHDAYNGSISTTTGVVVVKSSPLSMADARALADTRFDNLTKWGPCEAIPLAVETRERWVSLPGYISVNFVSAADLTQDEMRAQIAKAAGVPADEVARWSAEATPVKTIVKTVAPKGPTETRYFVTVGGSSDFGWDFGYPSQAEARAALDVALRHASTSHPAVTGEVVAMTRRASGEPLVTGTATTARYQQSVSVSLRRCETRGTLDVTRRGGWLFYGFAAM